MIVENQLKDILKTRKVHLTLIDPEEQTPEVAVEIAKSAISGGTDGIMLGGSTTDGLDFDNTAKALSENICLPIIIFPGNTSNVSKYADAIFFMSFLNSNNPYWIIEAQALGVLSIKKANIEAIPMGYMVISPGGTVGWIGDAKLVPRNKPKIIATYAMAAEALGMRFFYLETGSGSEKHVPPEMVVYTKKATDDTVIVVGGGIRDAESAYILAKSGADIVVTGTIVEEADDVESKIAEIVLGITEANK